MGSPFRRHGSVATKVTFWLLPVAYCLLTATHNVPRVTCTKVDHNQTGWRHLLETEEEETCVPAAIEEFPDDFLTQSQRIQGGVVFHIFVSLYMCYALAIVCDDYFVPSLSGISEALHLPSDVAGATFMAAGTSAPELFTSIVGSFITQGDIGVGTIVGSAVFNILAVVSVCGLISGVVVPLDWWPLTRDCFSYFVTVIALIIIIVDSQIQWYESVGLLIMFILYIVMMYFNTAMEKNVTALVHSIGGCCREGNDEEKQALVSSGSVAVEGETENNRPRTYSALSNGSQKRDHKTSETESHRPSSPGLTKSHLEYSIKSETNCHLEYSIKSNKTDTNDQQLDNNEEDDDGSIFSMPYRNPIKQVIWVIMWPAKFLFYITIPDCRKENWSKWYIMTFLNSIVYIAGLSYLLSWMVTVIGHTFGIPDTVMGLTFLAAGTSVPEAISSVIVCRQGFGNMAISNSVGSNVFDILFCLGFPWLLKSLTSSGQAVHINSQGLEYSVIALLTTVVFMYGALAINKFKLDRRVGACCLLMYGAFLTVSSLFELNVFGQVNMPSCPTDR